MVGQAAPSVPGTRPHGTWRSVPPPGLCRCPGKLSASRWASGPTRALCHFSRDPANDVGYLESPCALLSTFEFTIGFNFFSLSPQTKLHFTKRKGRSSGICPAPSGSWMTSQHLRSVAGSCHSAECRDPFPAFAKR